MREEIKVYCYVSYVCIIVLRVPEQFIRILVILVSYHNIL